MLRHYIIHKSHSLRLSHSTPFPPYHSFLPSLAPIHPPISLPVQSFLSPAPTLSDFLPLDWLVHSHWREPYTVRTTIHIIEKVVFVILSSTFFLCSGLPLRWLRVYPIVNPIVGKRNRIMCLHSHCHAHKWQISERWQTIIYYIIIIIMMFLLPYY